jgi:T5orf172 domain
MATGSIYVVGSLELPEYIKIGCSRSLNVSNRMTELQCGNPFQLHLWGLFHTKHNLLQTERWVHYKLLDLKYRSEWFKGDPQEVSSIVERLVKTYAPHKCKIL